MLWFFGKVLFFIFIFIWLRGSLPRLRYDQFMAFGWKRLIPIALVWIVAVATIRAISLEGGLDRQLPPDRHRRRSPCSSWCSSSSVSRSQDDEAAGRGRAHPGGFPVPPMPAGGAVRGAAAADLRARTADHRTDRCHAQRSRGDLMADSPKSRRVQGPAEQFWDPVAGFGVTFRTMFKKVVTEQYPFEKLPTAPRFHGRHQLNRWPDGLEKCIGCELCAWACPADAIYVEGASNDDAPTARGASAPVSATAASTRSTTCAASCAACASRPARPGRSR